MVSGMGINEKEMTELIAWLNERTKEYDAGTPTVSDMEWDNRYFQLVALEEEAGYAFANSPTRKIIYEVKNELAKVQHNHLMLSLDKTKDIAAVAKFLTGQNCIAMLKMDGLTCSIRYFDGKLISAETRGNGVIGEDILHNALVVEGIPRSISYKGELIVDGEIICTYDNFELFKEDYKNPRNFAAGSIRLLDSSECAKRSLGFIAWDVVKGFDEYDTLGKKLDELSIMRFRVVPNLSFFYDSTINNFGVIEDVIATLKESALTYEYPIDGIVFKYDNIEYYKSLGNTEHHFRGGLAYKFYDETYESTLTDIEWGLGRTGVLTPVAIFEPIDIDGSEVSRASLHNLSIMEDLWDNEWRTGLTVEVFKANQIIPQIKSVTHKFDSCARRLLIPKKCPVCGGDTIIKDNDGVKTLWCANPTCEGKLATKIDHFCSKKGMDIKGLSSATIEKLIDWNWLEEVSDLYKLNEHRSEWIKKAGFGIKSVDNILAAIEASKQNVELEKFIAAIGIPGIGVGTAKDLCNYFDSWESFRSAVDDKNYHFWNLDGFGPETHDAIKNFDYTEADFLASLFTFETLESLIEPIDEVKTLAGITVVITGKLSIYKNRAELTAAIERMGGKVAGSVSKNTHYLINNDNTSTSAKNVSAQKLGIPILTESEFKEKFLTN